MPTRVETWQLRCPDCGHTEERSGRGAEGTIKHAQSNKPCPNCDRGMGVRKLGASDKYGALMTDGGTDVTEKVERTDVGYRLTVESTRGTGTRDQDKVKAEARTETLSQLREEVRKVSAMVSAEMDRRRSHAPDTGGEDSE